MEDRTQHLESARLLLRPWGLSDAPVLFRLARSERVGPLAGWPPHTSEEMSREVIRTIFNAPETYAVVLKTLDEPIGCIGLVPRADEHCGPLAPDERELGYWIGEEHWGRGYMPCSGRSTDRPLHGFRRTLGLVDRDRSEEPQLATGRRQMRLHPPTDRSGCLLHTVPEGDGEVGSAGFEHLFSFRPRRVL